MRVRKKEEGIEEGDENLENVSLLILVALLWFSALLLLKKAKLNFFKFLAGSIGVFTISMFFFLPFLERNLNGLISSVLGFIGDKTGYFEVFKSNSIISVDTKSGIVSILLNYECSGVIEMLVFTSLALFFPFGGIVRKGVSIILGNLYLYAANLIRIIFIAFGVKTFGASAYYIFHTLFARILFFILTIILYYFTFTSTHLKYQRVGEID